MGGQAACCFGRFDDRPIKRCLLRTNWIWISCSCQPGHKSRLRRICTQSTRGKKGRGGKTGVEHGPVRGATNRGPEGIAGKVFAAKKVQAALRAVTGAGAIRLADPEVGKGAVRTAPDRRE